MAKCSKCGFSMDDRRPLPSRCPRCGTQTGVGAPPPFADAGASPDAPPGAPPAFGESVSPGTTIFGVPSVDPDELTAPLGKPDSKIPPPPQLRRPPPSESSGPPEIRLDLSESSGDMFAEDMLVDLPGPREEPQRHNEFDPASVGPADDALELDLPVAKPSTSPGRVPGPPPLSPSSFTRPAAPPPPQQSSPDALDFGPAPSVDDLDLPSPTDLDLPMPAAPKPPKAPPARVAPPPAPDLDALTEDDELLRPVDFDLPAPGEIDLPTPSDDLPVPAGMDVEPANSELRPANMDVEPAHLGVEPANLGVEPANIGVEPAHLDVDVHRGRKGKKGEEPAVAAFDPLEARRSPVPKPLPRERISRSLIYGGLALVLVVGAGVAAWSIGLFEPVEEGGQGRGLQGQKDAAEGGGQNVGPAAEPSEEFLAELRADTPASYAAAIEKARKAGNEVAEAEATLLMHLRYGPDNTNATRAATLVGRHASETKPHVSRVLGLAALAGGDLAKAEKSLAGDDPRTRLYRGWLRLAQGKPADAQAEAEAVLAQHDDDMAAHTLRYEALLAQDPAKAVEQIEERIAEHTDHPGLREVAIEAGLKSGLLARARHHAADMDPPQGALDSYRAKIHALRGRTFAAVGDFTAALAAFEEAEKLAPKQRDVALAKVRTLVDAKQLAEARAAVGVLVEDMQRRKENAELPEALLLQAEVSVASGQGDEALKQLAELQKLLPEDPRVPYLVGETHAMKLEVEEAQKAYATALEHDPGFYQAPIGEARLLHNARKGADALEVLDEARKKMAELENASEAKAALSYEKARLFDEQNQTTAALTALDQALEAAPGHNDAQLMRGLMRLRQGETEAGRSDLVAVYERTGGYPGLTGPLGRLFAREGNLDELERLVGDAAEDPQAPVENKLVATRLRMRQGRIDDAKSLVEQVLAREPNSWEGHLLMAEALLEAGDAEAALAEIERVRPRDPVAELHLLKGQILEYNNRHDEAGPEYRRALEIDPKLHEARMWYGRLLALDGANKAAIDELRKVVDATGDDFPRAWLNLGRAYRGLNEAASALEHLHKATELDPTLYEGFYLQGRIHAERNEHARAVSAFEKATVDDASAQWWYVNALMDLGRALAKAGRNEAAVAAFEKFLATAPENHAGRGEAERQVAALQK